MKAEEFEQIWLDQVQIEKSILLERAAAYATNGDRLGNFYEGAALNDVHPMRYGFNLVTKQIVALRDLIKSIDNCKNVADQNEKEKITEYITDIRNYMMLLKALYIEQEL